MQVKQLTSDISVAGQISPSDVPELAALGFKSIICNRPDGEARDQPLFEALVHAAGQAGLSTRYLPISSRGITPSNVAEFEKVLEELPRPVLAYCRVGARSASLWALSQNGKRPIGEIIQSLRAAGFY
jgi:sulfide:quinone oxidoreductase